MPCPPPMHSVTTPRFSPSRFIECSSRVVRTAPLAPIGWPCAIAPPSTLTTSSAKAEFAHDSERDGGEGLVDLDALDVADLPAGALERLAHRRHRADAEHAGLDRADAVGDEARHRLQAVLLAQPRSATIIAAAPLLRPGALPAVIVPSLRKAGLQLGQRLGVVSGRLCSSFAKAPALAALHLDRARSPRRTCPRPAPREALLRAQRPAILVLAADAGTSSPDPRCASRNAAGEGVVQAVAQHAVEICASPMR
jgi:hypothetical protein